MASIDLAPSAHLVDLEFGSAGFLPGWTARGYPNLQG